MKAFLRELRRRNVLRAALLYIGAIWALAQGIAQLTPELGMPTWSTRAFVVAGAIGFPLWLLFAWFYELTPAGLRRESEVPEGESITHQTRRKLDYLIVGVLALAVVLLLTDKLVSLGTPDAASIDTMPEDTRQSIAVLPLANSSGDPEQEYFSDGLTEELIAGLSRIDNMKVIGRSSSFQFKGSNTPGTEVARKLGVAHLLEGSVRQQRERVRILIALVRADDGSTLWTQTYDRELTDIFAVQREIAQAVAAALQVELSPAIAADIDSDQPPSGNAEAYKAYLQGRTLGRRTDVAGLRLSLNHHREALKIDPRYAAPHLGLSLSLVNLSNTVSIDEARPLREEARQVVARAVEVAPDNLQTLLARAHLMFALDNDFGGAEAIMRRALVRVPNDASSLGFMGTILAAMGRTTEAIDHLNRALMLDPLSVRWRYNLSAPLISEGQLDQAERLLQEIQQAEPSFPSIHVLLADVAALRGDVATIQDNASQESDPDLRRYIVALGHATADDKDAFETALHSVVEDCESELLLCYTSAASLTAFRHQPDRLFEYLERMSEDPRYVPYLSEPFLRRYWHDPRFVAHLAKYGMTPPTADPAPATSH